MNIRTLRIGTRDSELAIWQANKVKELLKNKEIESELIPIKSDGDTDLITPLYAMGVQGVFTKILDSALLNNKIDIAVHSMKDVPTHLAKGLKQVAVLPRANYKDLLITKEKINPQILNNTLQQINTIATGSIRRKAQWLNKYSNHKIENLRGNINTRLRKLEENNWLGAIFAAAGLERINLKPENYIELDWMIPAPAQGAIVVVAREEDDFSLDFINDYDTEVCVKIERDFLQTLMGGCSTPIGALAKKEGNFIFFKGNILSPEGEHHLEIEFKEKFDKNLGIRAAEDLLKKGADKIVEKIRNAGL